MPPRRGLLVREGRETTFLLLNGLLIGAPREKKKGDVAQYSREGAVKMNGGVKKGVNSLAGHQRGEAAQIPLKKRKGTCHWDTIVLAKNPSVLVKRKNKSPEVRSQERKAPKDRLRTRKQLILGNRLQEGDFERKNVTFQKKTLRRGKEKVRAKSTKRGKERHALGNSGDGLKRKDCVLEKGEGRGSL